MRNLILFLFLLPLFVNGQDVAFSDDYTIRHDVAYYLIDDMEGSFVLFRDIPKERKIHVMNDQMMNTGEVPIEFEFKNPKILDVVKARDKQFSVIYSAKKKGRRYLRIENFDKFGVLRDSMTINQSSNMFEAMNFQIEKSEDESMVLIYNIKYDRTIEACLVDIKNLEVLWSQTFDDLDIKQMFQIKQFVVGNDGSFCLALLKDNSNLSREKTRFELLTYNRATNKLDLLKLPMDNRLVATSIFKYDVLNNTLLGAGLFSEKNTIKAKGTFFIRIPIDNPQNHTLSFIPFTEDFIKEYLRKKNIGLNAGIHATEIQDLVLRKDGGILLIGEKIESKLRSGINIPVSFDNEDQVKADFYYDQIFISAIHPDGKEHWTKIFQKKQYSFDDGAIYSSFFLFVAKRGLHLLFNDEIRNHSTISDFTIKGNGEYKRRAIFNTYGVDIKLRVRDALQTSANEIIIPSQYRNKLRMVKFSF